MPESRKSSGRFLHSPSENLENQSYRKRREPGRKQVRQKNNSLMEPSAELSKRAALKVAQKTPAHRNSHRHSQLCQSWQPTGTAQKVHFYYHLDIYCFSFLVPHYFDFFLDINFFVVCLFVQIGSHFVVKNTLELIIFLLSQLLKYWENRHKLLHPAKIAFLKVLDYINFINMYAGFPLVKRFRPCSLKFLKSREMVLQSRMYTVLAEDHCSVPSTHVERLTNACNFSPRGSNSSFWSAQIPAFTCSCPLTDVHVYT